MRAYVGLQAIVGSLRLALLPFHWLVGPFLTIRWSPWIGVPLLAVNTWAAFRTRKLLRNHDPEGALLAGGTLACNVGIAWNAGHPGIGTILSGVGVALAVNVYIALRRADRLTFLRPRPDEELKPTAARGSLIE